jgi:DNA gyrase subunit A
MGRTAAGVRGIRVDEKKGDTVVGMVCVDPKIPTTSILVVSEKGMGKRSALEEYRTQSRGGKGIKTINVTAKTGHLVAIKAVTDQDDLMITTTSGVTIRTAADALRVMGRATQGVRLIRLDDGDDIADVTVVATAVEIAGLEAEISETDSQVEGTTGETGAPDTE